MMFIQETKCSSSLIKSISQKLGKPLDFIEVASTDWEGGITTFWDSRTISFLASEATHAYIATEIQITGNSETYLCVNVYGPQRLDDKFLFLNSLQSLQSRYQASKIIISGDFNMITSLLEKKGGLRKLNRDAGAFADFIESAKLMDEQPSSYSFTWNNRRGGENLIASRLDRFLISESIVLEGITVCSNILPSGGSDHWPISLEAAFLGTPRNKPFCFEKFWLQHPNFVKLLEQWWSEPLQVQGTKMFKLQSKLKHIKSKIKHWNTTEFCNIFKEKSILEGKLERIHTSWISGDITEESKEKEKDLMTQWHQRSLQEETLWKQKSRVLWLKEGKQNSKFFHRSTLDYRNTKKILNLKNASGDTLHNHREISSLMTDHFKRIAQESPIDRTDAINSLMQSIPKVVTKDQNLALLNEISMEEVEEAVKSMPNDKSPGPDGFTIKFFKACWQTIKTEIWEVVEDSRRSGTILKSFNSTFLALIPKEENAQTPEKFKPIALCNVIYKIISKFIANRLKPILPNLFSEEQSGYVEGRQILDNILLAQEMVHTLQIKKKAGMLMQLDLSKAFDKVNWNYLEVVLIAFGFDKKWNKWILALIKSSSFSILVNGSPSETFTPSRGIRQGDPLSPFLFVVLMEGFSRLIHKAKADGNIRGLRPLHSSPATTHQQFVDDTLLHGTPTVKEALAFKSILTLFSKASGILHRIRTIQRTFLWRGNAEKNKWALVAWNKLCKSKSLGGLNLIDPQTTNNICGAKLWWRWLKEPHLPWAKHWKEKYTPNCSETDLIRLQEVPEGSPIWNLAKRNRNIIQDHSFWEIRNGNTTLFWEDAWQQLPCLATLDLENYKREVQSTGNYKVNQYWSQNTNEQEWRIWNPSSSISFSTESPILQSLLTILNKRKIRTSSASDQLRWGKKGNDIYTLKEARIQLEQNELGEFLPWSTKISNSLFWPKIKTFLWLLMQGKTLTWDNLRKKGFSGPSICPMCRNEEETINHLFSSCLWANSIWKWLENIMQQYHKNRNFEFSQITLSANIRELISTKCTGRSAENPSPRDQRILASFKLDTVDSASTASSHLSPPKDSPGWHKPPASFLKINFDGASRGNPGPAGIGGVVRNHGGEILYIYSQALGEATNNEMEFAAMEKGLRILHANQMANVVIEGDSELAITAARRIYHGTPVGRVMKHWRLAQTIENIAILLRKMKGLTFQAIRRKGNAVADHLANVGIENPDDPKDSWWEDIMCPDLKATYLQHAEKDMAQTENGDGTVTTLHFPANHHADQALHL
eukprot:PITA_26308